MMQIICAPRMLQTLKMPWMSQGCAVAEPFPLEGNLRSLWAVQKSEVQILKSIGHIGALRPRGIKAVN